MLRAERTDGSLAILYGEKPVFCFNEKQSYISAGNGKATYIMSHGSFKFKEKLKRKMPLYFAGYESADTGLTVSLADKKGQCRMSVVFIVENERCLRMRFTVPKDEVFNRLWLTLPAAESERIYGCGETFTHFNLRGQKVRIWVAEHNNAARIAKKLLREKVFGKKPERMLDFSKYESYYAQPTFVSSARYFLHAIGNSFMRFDFSHKDRHELHFRTIDDVVIGVADDYEALMAELTSLLGRQPILPEWVYNGAILGIQGGTQVLKDKLEKAKAMDTAIAGAWCQDWEGARITMFGKQLMWNWEWDSEWYKGLDEEIPRMKQEGIRFLGYCNPFLATEKNLYAYASPRGYCVKDKNGKDYLVKITTFPAAMVDLTNPEAYDWIKTIIKDNLIGFGLDGWMADFGEYLPTDCVLYSGEDPQIVHNTWPARWAKVNREAVEECGKLGEVLFFTRAGHTETVRYSTLMWNGDQHVDWSYDEGLASVIPASLSLAMSGFGLVHSDAGGYTTVSHITRSPELMMRWSEMNTFSLVMRTHEGNRPDDNAQFDADDTVLTHFARLSRIHRALGPYLMAADKENSSRGIPVMRPLFFYYQSEQDYDEKYEYLLGRDILVAPVLRQGVSSWDVYFPEDSWVHLWSGKTYGGGRATVDAQLGFPPVFCRASSDYLPEFLKLADA